MRYRSRPVTIRLLFQENNKSFVLLLQENKGSYVFKKTLVSVGEQSTEYVEILLDKTIKQNSKILTKGVFDVTN